MAKVTFSALVATMSGKIGGGVMSRWKGTDYIRTRVVPSNPKTTLQTAQREAMAHTLTLWQSIKSWAKDIWMDYGTAYGMSGYNAYVKRNIAHVKAGTAGDFTPENPAYTPVSAMAAAAGGAEQITITWTDDDASADDKVRLYYRKTESGSEEYAWSFNQEVVASDETATISGLDTAEEYEVAVYVRDDVTDEGSEGFNAVLDAG